MVSGVASQRPIYLVLGINMMGYALLSFYQKSFDLKTVWIGVLVMTLIYATYMIILKNQMGDEVLFLSVAMLASLGIIMVYRLDVNLGFKQALWFLGGILLYFMSYILFTRVKGWDTFMLYYVVLSFLFFTTTLALGSNIKGAKNWIIIGGFSFQLSEIIKIMFVFFYASFFSKKDVILIRNIKIRIGQNQIIRRLFLWFFTYASIGFLVLQRDWGSALLFFLTYVMLCYVFENTRRFILLDLCVAFIGAAAGYRLLYHIRVRVDTWVDPWKDIAGKGYQITQSLFAIGSGGFFGKGLGLGKPDLIPEVKTDFIFSAICEEMGIFGGVAVILLLFILCYRGFKIAMITKDRFYKAIAVGITVIYGMQAFIIVGGVIKLIPLTGITLPFVSYGGSSLISNFIALGILQGISKAEDRKGDLYGNE